MYAFFHIIEVKSIVLSKRTFLFFCSTIVRLAIIQCFCTVIVQSRKICILVLIEAAVKCNGRKKLHHARIFYIRLVYFYIRLLYYDDNTPAWCKSTPAWCNFSFLYILPQPQSCKIIKSEKKTFQLYRLFFYSTILHQPGVLLHQAGVLSS